MGPGTKQQTNGTAMATKEVSIYFIST